jgi:drug/metabolite transporter (DMT)-like permease
VGLAALTLLYGTAITIMFTVLPRLGVVGNSAIMNVEPVAALVLAWGVLDQRVAPVQVAELHHLGLDAWRRPVVGPR